MPLIKKCKICRKEFETKNFWIKKGWGKYCSTTCQYKGRRNGKYVSCFGCEKEIYRTKRDLGRSKSKKYFCTKSCQTNWRNSVFVGPKHANYTTGIFSYRSVLTRHKVPQICCLCKTKDTRVLAVHHIDKNRLNNKLENLAWLCHNCHFLVHHYDDERKKFMVAIV